ncbi:MAG: hypothetical protein HKN21_05845 [Candidatus Eisenbacteria bacterium]|uniref:Organic solvent tolerance-like N-terminal domain-containing protein n=1 Tax=Eiseniibacteriota bacterium TaxID=2212470 RepID=A0A7Y2H220_UNCEI|nr:hypothetical protein [Candidatus Eisenbacteria bacterium]
MRANQRWILLGLCLLMATPVLAAGPTDTPPESKQVEAEPVPTGQAIDDLLLNREQYFYSSFGRLDPFGSLLKGKFARSQNGDLLDVGELELKGVVWGNEDKFAVVEDKREHSHILREGDRVVNGRITRITQSSMTVAHYFFGETSSVTIYMKEEGEGSYDAP